MFADHVYGTRKVDDRIAEFDSEEALPAPGLVEYKGKPVESHAGRSSTRRSTSVRETWKKAHPKAKDGEGPFPYAHAHRWSAAKARRCRRRCSCGSRTAPRARLQWNDTTGERWTRYRLVTKSRAVSVELDPERRVLLDRDKLDDSRTREADGSASRRWTADFFAALQSVYRPGGDPVNADNERKQGAFARSAADLRARTAMAAAAAVGRRPG